MREVFDAHGVPHVVHADRGTSMTSKSVADLLEDLHVTRSHSRPKVSNDNPYSEAWFKTLKYAPVFPDRFASLADARAFMTDFVTWYNHAHRHSGIGLHTPADVHHGRHHTVRANREDTLAAARAAHPNGSAPTGPYPRSSTCPNRSGSTNPTAANHKPPNSRWPQSLDTFRTAAAPAAGRRGRRACRAMLNVVLSHASDDARAAGYPSWTNVVVEVTNRRVARLPLGTRGHSM